jgi:isoleucyl-tRNA synthetase
MLLRLPKGESKEELESLFGLIADELNVKKISWLDQESSLTELFAKPIFNRLGPKFGKKANPLAEKIKSLSQTELKKFKDEGKLNLELDGARWELLAEDVEISEREKQGWAVESENEYQVALSTTLTEELKDEGFARELVNKIQNMRKSAGFEVMDRIQVTIGTTSRLNLAIKSFEDYIKKETLAQKLSLKETKGEPSEEWDINGEKANISVQKVGK